MDELLTQHKIVNKQLGLLQANPSNNATNFSLENVTNLINAVTNVLSAMSTAGASTARTSKKKRTSKSPTKPFGRKPYPRDENGKIIRRANIFSLKLA